MALAGHEHGEVADFERKSKTGIGLAEEGDIFLGIVFAQALSIFHIAVDDVLFSGKKKLDIDIVAMGLEFDTVVFVGVVALDSDIDSLSVEFVASDLRSLLSIGVRDVLRI